MSGIIKWMIGTATKRWLFSLLTVAVIGRFGWMVYDNIYDRGYAAAKKEWDSVLKTEKELYELNLALAREKADKANADIQDYIAQLDQESEERRRLRDELHQERLLSNEPAGTVIETDTGSCYVYDINRLVRLLNQQRHPREGSLFTSEEGEDHFVPRFTDAFSEIARSP